MKYLGQKIIYSRSTCLHQRGYEGQHVLLGAVHVLDDQPVTELDRPGQQTSLPHKLAGDICTPSIGHVIGVDELNI